MRRGVFGLSRNHVFLVMVVRLAGLFMVIPNAATLLTFVLGVVFIEIQVRLEEELLAAAHGEDYNEYRSAVRRWI